MKAQNRYCIYCFVYVQLQFNYVCATYSVSTTYNFSILGPIYPVFGLICNDPIWPGPIWHWPDITWPDMALAQSDNGPIWSGPICRARFTVARCEVDRFTAHLAFLPRLLAIGDFRRDWTNRKRLEWNSKYQPINFEHSLLKKCYLTRFRFILGCLWISFSPRT